MRAIVIVGIALLVPAVLLAEEKPRVVHFSKEDAGKLPKGWKADKAGKGEGSIWKVVEDPSAPSKQSYVLAQMAEGSDASFNLCVADDQRFKDGTIRVAFKAMRGRHDQGGGIVWRYQDSDNYYVCRMNPLEDNFRVYKVVAGVRMQLATTKNDVKVPVGEWHVMEITTKGDKIACFLDGKKYLDVKDSTFKAAGKVGLWTKADAQTYFDDLTIRGK